MEITFYIAAVIAIVSTVMVITRLNAVHALLYLILSLLAVAVIFFIIGAPFIAALEVIIYAGAIMVLFVFVVMMLNLGKTSIQQENQWLAPKSWIGPGILALILLLELIYLLITLRSARPEGTIIGPKEVGTSLFSVYLIAVELAALLLLAGLVGAYHLGKRDKHLRRPRHRFMSGEVGK
jgi:NADH-quinone oxidoreductase subunit J